MPRIEFIDDFGFPPNTEFEADFDLCLDCVPSEDSWIELATAKFDEADPTFVTANELVFGIRQEDMDGELHTLVLGPKLATELLGLLNAWLTQQNG